MLHLINIINNYCELIVLTTFLLQFLGTRKFNSEMYIIPLPNNQ